MLIVEFADITAEDLELIRNWRNSKHVSDYMFTKKYISKKNQIIWYSSIINLKNSKYWIIKYNNLKVGVVNLTNIDFLNSSCNWGFYVGELEYRECGVGAQTEFLIIEKIFNELKLGRINCEVISNNISVLNLHRRFGFKIISNDEFVSTENIFSIPTIKLYLLQADWIIIRDRLKKIIFNNFI